MRKFALLVLFYCSWSSWAVELSEAKLQGFVGEQINGYIGIVKGDTGEITQLVRHINQQRYDQYNAIASRNSAQLKQVELVGGRKALAKTPSGFYVKSFDGRWRKR